MKTFNFVIPDPLRTRLEAESARSGISLAEIVRRAVDEYLDRVELKARHECTSDGRKAS